MWAEVGTEAEVSPGASPEGAGKSLIPSSAVSRVEFGLLCVLIPTPSPSAQVSHDGRTGAYWARNPFCIMESPLGSASGVGSPPEEIQEVVPGQIP